MPDKGENLIDAAINGYSWLRNEEIITKETLGELNLTIADNYLNFNVLDQLKHNGDYKCRITLNNTQTVNSSAYKIEIFKSK